MSFVSEYLKSQLKRLDTLFHNTPEAKQACIDLNHSFKDSHFQIIELYKQIESYEKEFNIREIENIKEMRLEQQDKLSLSKQTILFGEKAYKDVKLDIQERQRINVKDVERQLKDIFKEQQTYLEKVKQEHSYLKKSLKEDNDQLNQDYDLLESKHLDKLNQLHEQRASNQYRLSTSYHELLKSVHKRNKERLEKTASVIQSLESERDIYFDFHKNDLVYIRQNFHRISVQLNNKISEVDQLYKTLFQNTDKELLEREKDIESVLNSMHEDYQKQNRDLINHLEKKLIRTDERLDNLKFVYERRLKNLTKHYQKNITDINTEKTLKRAEFLKRSREISEAYHSALNQIPTSDKELIKIEKLYAKEKNALDKEISACFNDFDFQIKKRKDRYYKDRLNLGYEYIHTQELYRYYRFIQDKKKNNDLAANKLTFKKHEVYMNKLNALFHLEKEKKNEIIETGKRIDLLPIDIQILLARHIHDLEINYLNLEQNYTKENYAREIALENLESSYQEINLNIERDKENIVHTFEEKQNDIDAYLLMEYEKNSLDGHKRILEAQKLVNESKFAIEILFKEHEKEIYLEKQTMMIEQLRSGLRIYNERLSLEDAYQKEINRFEYDRASLLLQRDSSIVSAKETINTATIENTRFQKVLSSYFLMLQSLHVETERILYALKDAYLSSSYFGFSKIIISFVDILHAQKKYKDTLIEEIKTNLKEKIQRKIDELTLSKYEKEHKKILDIYEEDKKSILKQRFDLNDQIKALRSESTDLYTEIASLENEIEIVKKTIKFTTDQIKTLSIDKNKQSKKTAKNLNVSVQGFKKEIGKKQDEIKHIHLKIEQIKGRIQFVNKGYKPIDDMLITLKINKEKSIETLKNNQYLEGRVYYDNLSKIDEITKFFKLDNKQFIDNVEPLLKKMNLETLTQKEFKSYYHSLFKQIEKHRKTTQKVHRQLGHLIDKQHSTVKNEQQRIIAEFNKNFTASLAHLQKTHKQELKKIEKNENELISYQKSLEILSKNRLNKSLELHYQNQRHQLKQAYLKKDEQVENRSWVESSVIELLKATTSNRNQVLHSHEVTLKQEMKTFEKESLHAQQKMLKDIDDLKTNIADANSVYIRRLNYYASFDAQERERFNKMLHVRKLKNENEINVLRKDIASLNKKARNNETKVQKAIASIKTSARKKKFAIVRFEKMKLLFSIRKQRKLFANLLNQEKNTYI